MQRLPSNSELESVVGERKYPYVFNEGELLQFECLYKYSVKGENKKKKKKEEKPIIQSYKEKERVNCSHR